MNGKTKICAIIIGGDRANLKEIEAADYVIACDRGYGYAVQTGIVPDLYVGDFDSYRGAVDGATRVLELPREKDDTDTMAAVRYALNEGFGEIRLYCALGGRVDHFIGNLQVVKYIALHSAKARIISDECEIYVFTSGRIELERQAWKTLSVLALSDACTGVNICGAKYPLKDATISNDYPIGVSNEWADDVVKVSVRSGVVAVITAK